MKDLLTLSDFANAIGTSYNQVYTWVRRHGLPHIKIGAKWYIRLADYEEWLQAKITVDKRTIKTKEALMEIKNIPSIKVSPRIAAKVKRIYYF